MTKQTKTQTVLAVIWLLALVALAVYYFGFKNQTTEAPATPVSQSDTSNLPAIPVTSNANGGTRLTDSQIQPARGL